jgi:ferritin
MRPLISEELNNQFNFLVGKCFEFNRLLDRQMSLLDTKFCMPKTSSILHAKVAHKFPFYGDVLSDFQSARNNLTIYPATPLGAKDYNSPMEIFEDMLRFMQEFESDVYGVCDLAKEDNDYMSKVFLDSFMLSLIPMTKQFLLLVDKCEAYKDMQLFDSNIEDWIVL